MSVVIINGNRFVGDNITIKNNKVLIDGKDMTPDAKEINITVEGNVEDLDVDYCNTLQVTGNVNTLRSGSGDVTCNDVHNGVQTGSGDVDCNNINGYVQTGSGDVSAQTITGSVKTGSGDIKYKNK